MLFSQQKFFFMLIKHNIMYNVGWLFVVCCGLSSYSAVDGYSVWPRLVRLVKLTPFTYLEL